MKEPSKYGLLFITLLGFIFLNFHASAQGKENKTAPTKADTSKPTKAAVLKPQMITVPGGSYVMGDDTSDEADEKPAHAVTLKTFAIGKYEVTQAQWKSVMGTNPSHFKKSSKCPVEMVSYDDAMAFINKLNYLTGKHYRLPTEAEWEYAARGGDKSKGSKYSGSNDVDEVAWHDGNSGAQTNPVGQKKPNELGIYDMSGNVSEWCADWYDEGYYAKSPPQNPKNSAAGAKRVLRGGYWGYKDDRLRIVFRDWDKQEGRSSSYGFRLAMDIK